MPELSLTTNLLTILFFSQVHRILIHSGFKYSELLHDIALLHLKTEVTFTNYVQPICLWEINEAQLHNVVNERGIVVGWGLNANDNQPKILSQAQMPVVTFTQCLESNRNFFGLFLSDFTYCAGWRNGKFISCWKAFEQNVL